MAGLMDDAALVAVALRFPRYAVGDGESDELPLAVDGEAGDRIDLVPEKIRRDVGEGFRRIPAGDEQGRAEDLGRAGNAPAIRVVRRETGLGERRRDRRRKYQHEGGSAKSDWHERSGLTRAINVRTGNRLWLWHALESGQLEVLVQRERLADPARAHHLEARRVGETQRLIAVFAQPSVRRGSFQIA